MPAPATTPELKYSEVTFKAAHNAYDREEMPISCQCESLGLAVEDWQGGCRGLEIDLNLSSRNWMWSINHIGGYQGSADIQLGIYMADLADWHDDNPDHDPILITLDLKPGDPLDHKGRPKASEFAERLDEAIETSFTKDPFYRPSDLQPAKNLTLLDGAANWPTIAQLRGKFILCLTGDEDLKQTYLSAREKRLCFADKKFNPKDAFTPEKFPDRVFYNFDLDDIGWGLNPTWGAVLAAIAQDGRCLTRGYVVNKESAWDAAVMAGLSIIATDKIKNSKWATVGGGFAERKHI